MTRQHRHSNFKRTAGDRMRKSCESKKRFETEDIALEFIEFQREKYNRVFETYKCKFCGKFHLSRNKGVRR